MNGRETTAGHFCGQTQPHNAHVWQTPPVFGAATIISVYQCAGHAALDTPAAPTTEAGTYPCCGQCDPGCSGRHENPCPRCQFDTPAAMYAVADEGAARAKGELA